MGLDFRIKRRNTPGISETESTIPSPLWKEEALKERWYLGDTYNMSIGQGYTLVTPIQMAAGTMPFANGGMLCRPQFLKNSTPECKNFPWQKKPLK